MTHTLDDVIGIAEEKYGLTVTEENRCKYVGFLQRQLEGHGYDLNWMTPNARPKSLNSFLYLNLVVDKLLIFARLIREEPVMDEYSEEKTLLDADEKLKLLKVRASDAEWPDRILVKIYSRRQDGKNGYGLVSYIGIIDEIGKDPEVVAIWNRELSYKKDVGGKISRGFTKGGGINPLAGEYTGELRNPVTRY